MLVAAALYFGLSFATYSGTISPKKPDAVLGGS
jgi:hypothetical protein